LDRLYQHDESKIEQQTREKKSRWKLFQLHQTLHRTVFRNSFDLDVLRRRINFLQARAMVEFLEEMRMDAQVILASSSRKP
jgi:hypothetical protein